MSSSQLTLTVVKEAYAAGRDLEVMYINKPVLSLYAFATKDAKTKFFTTSILANNEVLTVQPRRESQDNTKTQQQRESEEMALTTKGNRIRPTLERRNPLGFS